MTQLMMRITTVIFKFLLLEKMITQLVLLFAILTVIISLIFFFDSPGRYSLTSTQNVNVSWNVKQFFDDCQDIPQYNDDLIIGIQVSSYSESDDRYNIVDFHTENINIKDILSQDHSLFSEKKDYIALPNIEDYIDTFPPLPEFDSSDPLQSLFNIVKWVGEFLKTVFGTNFLAFFKWLRDCFWAIIQNIGIALYNLVVDLRRLLIYLFKPSENFFSNEISKYKKIFGDKFSAIETLSNYFDTLKNNLLGDSSAPEWTFTWKDKELLAVDFSMFDKYRNTIHNVILAIAWTLFLKYIYKSLPSLISSMPN